MTAGAGGFQDAHHVLRIPQDRHFCLSFEVHAPQTSHNHELFCQSSSARRSASFSHHASLSYDVLLDELHHWGRCRERNHLQKRSCQKGQHKLATEQRPEPVPRPSRNRLNNRTDHLSQNGYGLRSPTKSVHPSQPGESISTVDI